MDWTTGMLILPFVGAAASFAFRTRTRVARGVALISAVSMLIGLATGVLQGPDPATIAVMFVIALAAVLALLGQQPTRRAMAPMVTTLALLGLGLGGLASGPPMSLVLLGGLMGTLALLIVRRAKREADPLAWGSVAGLAVGVLALAASSVATGATAAVLRLIACAVLLPLFPFHTAFVGSVSSLPGTLPAFLVVLLPALGWHALTRIIAEVPASLVEMLTPLALCGSLYVAVRASVQVHLPRTLASIATILIALVWWHAGATGGTALEAGWFLSLVTLASSGLLLASHLLEVRYGSMSLDRLQGLARPMPRFATLVGLLLMAAMGLPVFGVFAGFLGLVATAASPGVVSMMAVLLIWLAVSLLMVSLLQRLLFREVPLNLVHRDLGPSEMVALVLIIGLLAAAGMVPPDFLHYDQGAVSTVVGHRQVSP